MTLATGAISGLICLNFLSSARQALTIAWPVAIGQRPIDIAPALVFAGERAGAVGSAVPDAK